MGDFVSNLLIAPFLLLWIPNTKDQNRKNLRMEGMIMSSLVIGLNIKLFSPLSGVIFRPTIESAMLFVMLLWIALRFGQRLNILFICLVTMISIWGTVKGYGPIHEEVLSQRLFSLQIFIAAIAIAGLLFGALGQEKEKALFLRSEFISIASHELRTPLTSIELQQRVLREVLSQVDLGSYQEVVNNTVERNERQIKSLINLVERLLDVSQIEAGKLKLNCSFINLSDLVHRTIINFQTLLDWPIHVDIQRDVKGNWDEHRIEQVLNNLLMNAKKHAAKSSINVSLKSLADRVLIQVTDRGPGIPAEKLPLLFQKYERVFASPGSGIGLGLYISKQIVDAHKGKIWVESTPGEGSVFSLELPT
jgi:signal transduction histidine kinase